MRRRPVVTILMLLIAMILTLPLRAQQKDVAQGPRFGPAAFPSTYAATALPAGAQQDVAPGLSPAHAAPSASSGQPLKGGATTATSTPAKPFTQAQVQGMVRDGFGDESGAKLIEQRGIDFAPSENFIQTLKAAGASEAFLNALRAAKPPKPASAKKPLNQVQVFALLVGQVPSHRVTMLVQERGIDFEPTDDYLQEVRLAGGEDELVSALKSAKVTNPATVNPAARARQDELRQHVARGAELTKKGQYAEAEVEYRAALLLDSQNADLYASLAIVLGRQEKWDETASAAREALRLNPNLEEAHYDLGVALRHKGDGEGAIAEYREALRLDPSDDAAHVNLGAALANKGDLDGAITEYHEALRLNPNNDMAYVDLGAALGSKGDRDGAVAEFREAVRLNPNNDLAHANLGVALGKKGDWDGEIAECHEALRLNPNDADAHANLGLALGNKGDWDGEIAEEREALRLNPNSEQAHIHLALALWKKGDWDGVIAEEREVLRLDPSNDAAHAALGVAFEAKGDRAGALQEYRAAYELDPKNPVYRMGYERLLKQVNR